MTARSVPADEAVGIPGDLSDVRVGGRVARLVHAVALGITFLLAGSILALILVLVLSFFVVVVQMALGG